MTREKATEEKSSARSQTCHFLPIIDDELTHNKQWIYWVMFESVHLKFHHWNAVIPWLSDDMLNRDNTMHEIDQLNRERSTKNSLSNSIDFLFSNDDWNVFVQIVYVLLTYQSREETKNDNIRMIIIISSSFSSPRANDHSKLCSIHMWKRTNRARRSCTPSTTLEQIKWTI